ncbi:MAG: acetyl-CoA carboxylase carboxyltransferase subunit alpha [Clostridiaceae bacterium]
MPGELKTRKTAWDRVTLVRMIERPTALDYINRIFDSFIEFHGDRHYSDDAAIVGGIAMLDGMPVTVIGHQKGRNINENIKRNFGMPQPDGYRKALRLMKQAEKFNRPVICFVDTKGAHCDMEAEERGQGEAIARNLLEMSKLKTPSISVVIGEGGSGGALALAVSDQVWMLENSIYSILSPEGFAGILWKDGSRAKEAANIMKITAKDLKEYGIIDKIIKEPFGGAHKNVDKVAADIKKNLIAALTKLNSQPVAELVQNRYDKFRNMGKYIE